MTIHKAALYQISIVFCTLGFVPASVTAGDDLRIIESVYGEALGAGGVRFSHLSDDQFSGLLASAITEIKDLNNDGMDDLIFGHDLYQNPVQYALSEIREDGTLGFTLYQQSIDYYAEASTAGDIDGNGWADLVLTNYEDNRVEILWIDDGIVTDSTVEFHPDLGYVETFFLEYLDARITVRAGDLDGDGLADLVVNTSNQKIVVRWSSREAGSEYSSYDAPMLGTENVLYQLRDYDGDSDLDVLMMDYETEQFFLFEGDGTDDLDPPRLIDIAASGHTADLDYPVFGSFDSDPAIDMALYDQATEQTLLIKNFTNDDSSLSVLPIESDQRVECSPGDVDGSGPDDLLITGFDPLTNDPTGIEEKWLLFDPAGSSPISVQIETGNTPDHGPHSNHGGPRSLGCIAVDLNADGLQDLMWTSDFTYHKFFCEPIDVYTRGVVIRVSPQRDESSGYPMFGASQFEGQKDPLHMAPVDLDSDGYEELFVVGAGARGVVVDVEESNTTNVPGVNDGWMSAAADLDGNGTTEMVVSRIQNGFVILPIQTDSSFGERMLVENPNGNSYLSLIAHDFDLDGKDDVIALDYTNQVAHVYRGTTEGYVTFASVIEHPELGVSLKPGILDYNGDGYPDLIFGSHESGNTGFQIFINQQDGTFVASTFFQLPIRPYWIITEDMDMDGVIDIVSANYEVLSIGSGISVHFLNANGGIEKNVYLHDLSSDYIREVVAGDFDNDGLPDLVGSVQNIFGNTQSKALNRHQVWSNDNSRGFEPVATLPASHSSTVGMSDLNLDGSLDVITASDLDDSVRVHWGVPAACAADLTGEGDLNFLDISEFLSTQLDFNGDGSFNFLDISEYLQAFAAGCP